TNIPTRPTMRHGTSEGPRGRIPVGRAECSSPSRRSHARVGTPTAGIGSDTSVVPCAMDVPRTLRRARVKAGLSLRALAARAGTSHATVAAYEAGRAVPRVDTLDRILRAAGYATDIDVAWRPDATNAERRA